MAKELTDLQQKFLDALFDPATGGDIATACALAGYAPGTNSQKIATALADEIVDRSRQVVSAHAAKATLRAINIFNNPTELGSDRILAVVKEFWDRAGIVKKEKLEIETRTGGILLLPAKRVEPEKE